MTIEQLDKRRVLISLRPDDMDTYSLSIDKLNVKDSACRENLKKLLRIAAEKFGLSISDKAVLLEAMPHKDGLLILMTVDDMNKIRKVYRIKPKTYKSCCKFSDAESLLACAERLRRENISLPSNSLWQYKGKFYVVFGYSGISPRAQAVLSEFAECVSLNLMVVARICEAGKELVSKNAMEMLSKNSR